MVQKWQLVAILFVAAAALSGCSQGVKEETFTVKQVAALDQAKEILQRYAKGQPMASEASTWPQIIEDVKKTDPEKGKILEKGIADIEKSKANPGPKAKEILSKL
jgi:hypothetical protein